VPARPRFLWPLLALLLAAAAPAGDARLDEVDVFVSGKDGYHTFRIPAAVVSPRGTLLAFCKGRRHGRGDTGDIDVVLRRSFDGGKDRSASEGEPGSLLPEASKAGSLVTWPLDPQRRSLPTWAPEEAVRRCSPCSI
jgi:hypothetical protein